MHCSNRIIRQVKSVLQIILRSYRARAVQLDSDKDKVVSFATWRGHERHFLLLLISRISKSQNVDFAMTGTPSVH